MNSAQMAISGIVLSAAAAGGLLYYTQVYAFYDTLSADEVGAIELTLAGTDTRAPLLVENVSGIDSDSSPIRFRACFDLAGESMGTLTDLYQIYDAAEPLNAPGWFDCFDAREAGEALETGEALAFLGHENIVYGIDRVVAVMSDGRGMVWDQINACGHAKFNGDPIPDNCPTTAEGTK